jgi:hypothetical protein
VNNCSEQDFLRHEEEAFTTWEKRSKFDWKQDFERFEEYLGRISSHA